MKIVAEVMRRIMKTELYTLMRDKREREDGSSGSGENPEKVRRVEVIEKLENAETKRLKVQVEIKVDERQKMRREKKNNYCRQW